MCANTLALLNAYHIEDFDGELDCLAILLKPFTNFNKQIFHNIISYFLLFIIGNLEGRCSFAFIRFHSRFENLWNFRINFISL